MTKHLSVQDDFLSDFVSLKPNGLGAIIDPNINYDQWSAAIGECAKRIQRNDYDLMRHRLALADLLLKGEELFPDQYSQAMDSSTIDEKTISNAMWIAKNIPIDQRNPKLSLSHLSEIAGVKDQTARLELIAETISEDLTVNELRERREKKCPSKKRTAKKQSTVTEKVEKEKPKYDKEDDALEAAETILAWFAIEEKNQLSKKWPSTRKNAWKDILIGFRRISRRMGVIQ